MNSLITGINGFVGQHLSELLLKKGFNVFGADIIESKKQNPKINFIKTDITNKKQVSDMIKKSKPDYIFHLAAVSSVKTCKDNPELTQKVNLGGTENIMSACVDNNLNPKILITSSAHVYGIPKYLPIDESHPVNPVNEYGKSKLEQENTSLSFFNKNKLSVIISRSFNHIGPNQATGFVCSDFAKQIAEIEKGTTKPEIHVGDISSKRDFTDVRDIVKAYLLLIEKGKAGEIYNIGSGKGYTIKEILDRLIAKSKSKISIIADKSLFRKSDIPALIANNKKFVDLTGWKPEITLDKSLTDILNYWKSII
jgi:GDP-4-dehydro-6-deoxy-D-mannose reductase